LIWPAVTIGSLIVGAGLAIVSNAKRIASSTQQYFFGRSDDPRVPEFLERTIAGVWDPLQINPETYVLIGLPILLVGIILVLVGLFGQRAH